MKTKNIENLIMLSTAILLGLFFYQFSMLHFNQGLYPVGELQWIFLITVLLEAVVGIGGVLGICAWIYFEVFDLVKVHHHTGSHVYKVSHHYIGRRHHGTRNFRK